jgi:quercetin dioxygenase-like cupin family protein
MKAMKPFLLVCLVSLVLVSTAMAEEQTGQAAMPGPATTYQAKFPVTLQAGEYELLAVVLDFPPGAGMSNHMHGGHVLVTVLSGEMTLREKGTERILRTGESWTENPGDVHAVVNAGTANARVAVTMLLPKGGSFTTMSK